jgi:hypothetical protein
MKHCSPTGRRNLADLRRDFWIRESGTGQVAQLHDRYMVMMMMMWCEDHQSQWKIWWVKIIVTLGSVLFLYIILKVTKVKWSNMTAAM